MRPIDGDKLTSTFKNWLKEADSLAEREAIERCMEQVQGAETVHSLSIIGGELARKIQQAFPKAYMNLYGELILVPRTNTYINLKDIHTMDDFRAAIIEYCSRMATKAYTKPLQREHERGMFMLLDKTFTPQEMDYIYTYLGNGIRHDLCTKFVQSGYDLKVIEESV